MVFQTAQAKTGSFLECFSMFCFAGDVAACGRQLFAGMICRTCRQAGDTGGP
ncbi:hypothetical protein [Rubripirellula amarantea]|uniref:hypothetical protein n=1 Tax=Rubripirellula amarantea TaxID=2527999 RepID=UPI0013EF0961|nr:hypothetical protein [Rubripirellula amarantea]